MDTDLISYPDLTLFLTLKSEISLSLGRGRSGYEINTDLQIRGVPVIQTLDDFFSSLRASVWSKK